jgi:hypothetical protein
MARSRITVAQMRQMLEQLEAEGKGPLPVLTSWDQKGEIRLDVPNEPLLCLADEPVVGLAAGAEFVYIGI